MVTPFLIQMLIVFSVVGALSGCKDRRAAQSDTLSAKETSILSGKSYCRMIGVGGSAQRETCIEFKSPQAGVDNDTSSRPARVRPFTYKISGDQVVLTWAEPILSATRTLTLASNRTTLTLQEGDSSFVWELKKATRLTPSP